MKRKLEYALVGIFLVILLIAGSRLYQIWEGYHTADKEYEKLQELAELPDAGPDHGLPDKPKGQSEEPGIDFESLRQINPDIVAWIKIEAAGIDYPVVQGEDNEHYLHYTFLGEANIAGSIFLDYRNKADLSDDKIILYGHNMRDGSMFAALKNLEVEEAPIAVLYTPEETLQYQLSGENYVSPVNEIYQLEISAANRNKRTLILSTCSNDGSSRHVFVGKLLG